MSGAWRAVLGVALLVALGGRAPHATTTAEPGKGIPDDLIGLVHQDIREVPVPEAVHDNTSDPAERALPERWNDFTPPVIPHGVADFLPILRDENACVDCHATSEKAPGEPTPIPESHYRDLRNAPETLQRTIAGSRYVCTSCHVLQTDANPLPVEPR